jgi:hypothetical protein
MYWEIQYKVLIVHQARFLGEHIVEFLMQIASTDTTIIIPVIENIPQCVLYVINLPLQV